MESAMKPIRLDQDVRSLSEFRAGMSTFIQQVTETGRPLLLTQNGRGIAVVLDVREFEDMQERLVLYLTLVRSLDDIIEGRVIPHEQVVAELREEIKKYERPKE
jgi:prevent-host-death family protein